MKTKTCPECDGEGVVDKDTAGERRCPNCGGTGVVGDNDDEEGNILNTRPEEAAPAAIGALC